MASQKEKKPQRRLLNSRRKNTNKKLTQRNAEHSPLLALPAELRNRIYRYVFADRTIHIYATRERQSYTAKSKLVLGYSVCRLSADDSEPAKAIRDRGSEAQLFGYVEHHVKHGCEFFRRRYCDRLHLELLKTCRQVHQEAALLPYQLNTFAFGRLSDVFTLRVFLNRIMPIQGRAIRSLTLCPLLMQRAAPGLFSKLRGLQEITIYGFYHEWILDSRGLEIVYQHLEKLPLVKSNVCFTREFEFSHLTDAQEEALALKGREKARLLERRLVGSGDASS